MTTMDYIRNSVSEKVLSFDSLLNLRFNSSVTAREVKRHIEKYYSNSPINICSVYSGLVLDKLSKNIEKVNPKVKVTYSFNSFHNPAFYLDGKEITKVAQILPYLNQAQV